MRASERLAQVTAVLGTVALAFRLGRSSPRLRAAGVPDGQEDPSGRGSPGVPASGRAVRSGHETEDMSGGLMVRLGLMLGTAALVMIFVMIGFRTWVRSSSINGQPPLTALQVAPQRPPAPTLQANAVQEWDRVRADAEALLDHYAWGDPQHARARIPIARAMALTAVLRLISPPPSRAPRASAWVRSAGWM